MKQKYLFFLSFLLISYLGNSQNTVTGTVKDSQGIPLTGVSIQEVDTFNGAITDFDGNYSITLKSLNATLTY